MRKTEIRKSGALLGKPANQQSSEIADRQSEKCCHASVPPFACFGVCGWAAARTLRSPKRNSYVAETSAQRLGLDSSVAAASQCAATQQHDWGRRS